LGSCLEEPWALNADVIFANNLCFGRSLNVDIATICQKLQPGVCQHNSREEMLSFPPALQTIVSFDALQKGGWGDYMNSFRFIDEPLKAVSNRLLTCSFAPAPSGHRHHNEATRHMCTLAALHTALLHELVRRRGREHIPAKGSLFYRCRQGHLTQLSVRGCRRREPFTM
jgi:hypothetical protein